MENSKDAARVAALTIFLTEKMVNYNRVVLFNRRLEQDAERAESVLKTRPRGAKTATGTSGNPIEKCRLVF